jgi:deazaflavin-dependent oxidoreductase (nitroreductase family)
MTGTRVLYVSDSIGLGHAARDLAIARELRRLNPEVEIVWLAGDPARRLIAEAGETLLPETEAFAHETGVAENTSGEFSLNVLHYALRAQSAWKKAVAAFEEVTAKYPYDLLIGDESYEIDAALSDQPELKKVPFVMIYDFVGLDAMSRSPLERLMAYRFNWLWGGGPRGKPPTQEDLTLFIGEPEDVPDKPFGFLLPNRREYARRYYHFVGYAFPFDPADYTDKKKVRAALGYDAERPLVVCSVGGTSVGADLLRLCAASYPHIQERLEDVRMVLVCGPRIDPTTIEVPPGVEVRGYVARLYEHFAASDVAIVQGGGTTTLELTALRRPFIYFPLEDHFEQNLVVAKRLARHGAGERLLYSKTTPEKLAGAVVGQLGREVNWLPIPTDGARRAAQLIHELAQGQDLREATQPTFPSKRPGRVLRVFVKYPTRIYRGRLANVLAGRRELLLTTTGRKSGLPRTTPLNFITMDGAYVVAAAWGTHADWYQNLLADPDVTVQVGKRRFAARAHLVEEPDAQRELLRQLVRRSWQRDEPPRPVRWFMRTVFSYDYDAVQARAIEHPELVPVVRLVLKEG